MKLILGLLAAVLTIAGTILIFLFSLAIPTAAIGYGLEKFLAGERYVGIFLFLFALIVIKQLFFTEKAK